jgi:hypothetical protein
MDSQASAALLTMVAQGQLVEADTLLKSTHTPQKLLCHEGSFTDYSDRTFNCTAFEYAFWAIDSQMCYMLAAHMDETTKTLIYQKIKTINASGLTYEQNGNIFKNPRYDTCFILKNFSPKEFQYLEKILANERRYLTQANMHNYQTIPFNAIEYQILVETLKHFALKPSQHYRSKMMTRIAYPFWYLLNQFQKNKVKKLIYKLTTAFDFHSLILALSDYINHYDLLSYQARDDAWLAVGKAQREVPVHIAAEYCHPERSFSPIPCFTEKYLKRNLHFKNHVKHEHLWFPLSPPGKGLGYDFALAREGRKAAWCWGISGRPSRSPRAATKDLHAIKQLFNRRIQETQQLMKQLMKSNSIKQKLPKG